MNLREQAEKRAKQPIAEFRKQRGQDTTELIHELRVHQIELEIQNEELRNAQLELADSRNKYCELYDFAPVGYFTLNKEGLIVGVNLTGASFLGEERGNLLKSKFSHFIAPGSQDDFYLHHKKVVESRTRQSCEVKLRRKDGTEFPAQLVSVAVAEQKDEYDQFRMTMTDITEQKLAEEKLHQASTYNRSLIEASLDPLVAIGPDGKITDVNIATEAVTGYVRTVLVGTNFSDYFTEPKSAQAGYQQVFREGMVHDYPLEIRHRDGHVTPVIYNASVYRDKAGKVVGIFAAARNITKRKQAEERLQEERNLLRTLIDHIPGEVYVKDKESRFILCNKIVVESRKRDAKDNIIGKTDFDLFEHETAQQFFDEEQNLMQTGRPIINSEGRFISKSGEVFYCSTNKVPLRDSAGNITGLVGINYDITERKQVENKILEYQKHLKRLAARLTLAEEGERRRIAGAIHDDISQTLAMAKIKLDSLQSSPPSQKSYDEIKQISACIEKVIQETRTLTFELSNPILYELGFEAAVAEWLDEQVQIKHGIATEFLDDGKAKPLDDNIKVMLFRNIRELLINCIKHAKAKAIRVNIRRIDDSIEVTVEDNGVGFDPVQVRATAFKKAKFGLFSVRESLENTGGSFEIESKPGAGCKATMIAPIKNAKTDKEIDHAYENFIS
jgi:PAS domain S-box-containing protein